MIPTQDLLPSIVIGEEGDGKIVQGLFTTSVHKGHNHISLISANHIQSCQTSRDWEEIFYTQVGV